MTDRHPYVGEGADGARRSAEIDRSEADGLDRSDDRHEYLLASARRWDAQADRLDAPWDDAARAAEAPCRHNGGTDDCPLTCLIVHGGRFVQS